MITRITAEFESPELAELALKRVKESVNGVVRTGMLYNKTSDKAQRLRGGTMYTIIPTVSTMHNTNYMTAVVESPASEDVIPEPQRKRNARIYVICDASVNGNVTSILGSLGGLKIKSSV